MLQRYKKVLTYARENVNTFLKNVNTFSEKMLIHFWPLLLNNIKLPKRRGGGCGVICKRKVS